MKISWNIFTKKAKDPVMTIDKAVIDASYRKVAKEIESLRKYDRGEKEIDAPNLGTIMRDLQRSAR